MDAKLIVLLFCAVFVAVCAQRDRAPVDLFRIEIELQKLSIRGGLLAPKKAGVAGVQCDAWPKPDCDPRLSIFFDTDQPNSPFPGIKPVAQYLNFFEVSDNNNPTINKAVTKDFCGGAAYKVNLRVHAVDVDVGSGNDLIEDFNCKFTVDYSRIGQSQSDTDFQASENCEALRQPQNTELQFRYRYYRIPLAQCGLNSTSSV